MEISLVVWKNPNAAQEVCAEGNSCGWLKSQPGPEAE